MNDAGMINPDVRSYAILTDTGSVYGVSEACIRLSECFTLLKSELL